MPKHVTVAANARTILGAAPAFGTLVTVTSGILHRHIWGSITVAPTALNAASVAIQVETGVGTGIYSTQQDSQASAGAVAGSKRDAYHIIVPASFRYKFVNGALAGTTETVTYYSYADIG